MLCIFNFLNGKYVYIEIAKTKLYFHHKYKISRLQLNIK